MHALQAIPHAISLLHSHPARRHEQVEDEIHHEQQYDQIEDLHEGVGTMVMERLSLRLTM